MLVAQEYTQLKTELANYVRVRNNLNTFMITTFFTVLALAYKYAANQPYIFLFAQILMIPVLVRIMDYRKTECRLSKCINEKFQKHLTTQWEKEKFENRAFYFEFFTLSALVTVCLSGVINTSVTSTPAYTVGSFVLTVVIGLLTYKSNKLSTYNCDKTWCQLFFGNHKSKKQTAKSTTTKTYVETNNMDTKSEQQTANPTTTSNSNQT